MLPRFRSRELGLFTEIKLQFDKLVRPSFSGLEVQGWAKKWTPGCENDKEVVSNSRNKLHQTLGPLLAHLCS